MVWCDSWGRGWIAGSVQTLDEFAATIGRQLLGKVTAQRILSFAKAQGVVFIPSLSMLSFILKKFAGRHHRKYIEKTRPIVARINEFEQQYQSLTDDQLRAKTDDFRARLKQGETTDQILPEAFAAVKNAARRLVGRPVIVCDHELKWEI